MKKSMKITVVAALVAILGSSAFAQTTTINTNANANASAAATINSSSVGLAGLAGGACSEGFTFGIDGMGLGISSLNRACIVLSQINNLVSAGIYSKQKGEAIADAALAKLGFKFKTPVATASSSSKAVSAAALAPKPRPLNKRQRMAALPSYGTVGAWGKLTHAQQNQIMACDALLGGRGIKVCSDQY